jgi:hypothetical protein
VESLSCKIESNKKADVATEQLSPALAIKPVSISRADRHATGSRSLISMAKEWIENLAQDIKQKKHEAAEDYGREQHNTGIIADLGMPFFTTLVSCLEEDIAEIRRQLQGDLTSSDTTVQVINGNDVKLTRSRFPWFDAHVTHQDANIILDYAKDRGVAGDPNLDRKNVHFAFNVAKDDDFSVQEAFSENPRRFQTPEELAKHIIELLFQA